MQSVPITTDVVSLNLDMGEVYNIMWLATGQWFSPGTPVSSTNKTDRHDITEILLKVSLDTITLTLTVSIYKSTKLTTFNHGQEVVYKLTTFIHGQEVVYKLTTFNHGQEVGLRTHNFCKQLPDHG
jgi:hypothetical protein